VNQDDDLILGWRYFATLQLRTPLAYLEMEGEFSAVPKEPPLVGLAENFWREVQASIPTGCGFERLIKKNWALTSSLQTPKHAPRGQGLRFGH
jgi:hypothetical protein